MARAAVRKILPAASGSESWPLRVADPNGLGLPLSLLHVRRLEELEQLVGRYRFGGWGRYGASGLFFVDVGDTRFQGETLHLAIGAAMRAAQGARP
jgi:hypothetical protein